MQELLEITGSKSPSIKLKELSFPCRQVVAGNRRRHLEDHNTTPAPRHARETKTSDGDVRDIIDACVGLRTYRGSFFQQQAICVLEALLKHRMTLKVLDLECWGSDNSTSGMVQALLSACPNLEQFSAMGPLKIGSEDIASGDPILQKRDLSAGLGHIPKKMLLICGRLRVLKLQFQSECMAGSLVDEDCYRRVIPCQLVVELSRLAHLEDLGLGRVKSGSGGEGGSWRSYTEKQRSWDRSEDGFRSTE
ncbi:hypothetical protein MVEG_04317 [Podila verticillata NRRL 6337]|nr:hypothetical protein MVEG_04317 [Podila verticillata NRRL 6337]